MSQPTHKAVFKFRIKWNRGGYFYSLQVERTYWGSPYSGRLPHFRPLDEKPRTAWQKFWQGRERTYWESIAQTEAHPTEEMRDKLRQSAQNYADKVLQNFLANKKTHEEIGIVIEVAA